MPSRESRSKAYQYKFCEFGVDNEIMEQDPDETRQDNQIVLELRDKLAQNMLRIMKKLTYRQQFVMRTYYFGDMTQHEISNLLHYSSQAMIHHALTRGNHMLKKFALEDAEILNLMVQLSDLGSMDIDAARAYESETYRYASNLQGQLAKRRREKRRKMVVDGLEGTKKSI